ncbi:MAG: dTDP-4-amino-4,6-dideoxygalactose transaminase [Acidimicrobiales bacterium]|nr:dTDP-4-amino-4,6-dideoxygalactose transaminase [Acidimicrobiales bacterium]
MDNAIEVPFNRPCLAGQEMNYIAQAVANGHSSAKGPFTERAEHLLTERLNAEGVLLTTSCTDALEMAAMMVEIGPGDVVIVPSFTFSSTATAFARQGAKLRFCDIRKPDLGLDPDDVEASMDDRVKAIVTVHYAGVASDVTRLQAIAQRFGVPLIEDNAHGLFADHDGKQLGSFGRFSTLSFHETKNFICGEGGALVVNNEGDLEAAHILLDKGTNRRQFLDGLADKYTWHGHGSSFGLSDLLAAFLLAQLERADEIQSKRRKIHGKYTELLMPHTERLALTLPYHHQGDKPADHMFYVLLPSAAIRGEVIKLMRSAGVQPTFHYVPLHSAPGASELADSDRHLPVTDDISGRLLRMPFFNELTEHEQERVALALVEAVEASILSTAT